MVKLLVYIALISVLQAQPAGDLERRVAEPGQKMRLIDPAFGADTRAADLAKRLEALEAKMQALVPAPQVQTPPAPIAAAAITSVSVSGDYQGSPSNETRLPVAGYMDFHVNKDTGQPFRPDRKSVV